MKSGMYGEMPIIKVGRFEISEMNDKEGCKSVWIRDTVADDGGEFHKDSLEKVILEFYDKNF